MTEAPVVELARTVAGFGAPGVETVEPREVTEPVWSQFLSLFRSQRISGLAVAAADAGVLQLSDEQWSSLMERHQEAMAWTLLVERTLLDVAADLGSAGVRFLVLKGPTLAHTMYPDPSWRAFGDLDILVEPDGWRRAGQALERAGAVRDVPEPRKGFDERFGKAAVFQNEHDVEIDLHVRLVLGPFGLWMEMGELFDRTVALPIGGRSVLRLQDTEQLLHACVHASLGTSPPLLVPLRDVVQIATIGDVDWPRFEGLTHRWRLGVVVRHAMDRARKELRVSMPPEAERSLAYTATAREEGMLRAYTTPRRASGALATSTLSAIPDLRSKVSYLRALVLPDRDFLEARTGSRRVLESHLRRWTIPAGWIGKRGGTG